MKKALIFLTFFILFIESYGQSTICDCCTYETLHWTENFEKWFPSEIIKKNNIHELTIYTTSSQAGLEADSTFKTVDSEYREMTLRFNESGFVTERIYFNSLGQYHSINEFQRDGSNKILTKSYFYLDSNGVKRENFLRQKKWIYIYENGKLIKSKQLNQDLEYKFYELPDRRSEYFSYKYDSFGREIETIHQTYYDGHAQQIFKSKTKYNDRTNSSVMKTSYNGKVFSTETTSFNPDKNPIEVHSFDNKRKETRNRTYQYNESGVLVRLTTEQFGGYTECLDGGDLIEVYSYSDTNLLTSIEHRYKSTICLLRFEFR